MNHKFSDIAEGFRPMRLEIKFESWEDVHALHNILLAGIAFHEDTEGRLRMEKLKVPHDIFEIEVALSEHFERITRMGSND